METAQIQRIREYITELEEGLYEWNYDLGMRPAITAKKRRFCEEYVIDCNGKQSAIRAGYSKNAAKEQAFENLTKPHIKKYIKKLQSGPDTAQKQQKSKPRAC